MAPSQEVAGSAMCLLEDGEIWRPYAGRNRLVSVWDFLARDFCGCWDPSPARERILNVSSSVARHPQPGDSSEVVCVSSNKREVVADGRSGDPEIVCSDQKPIVLQVPEGLTVGPSCRQVRREQTVDARSPLS